MYISTIASFTAVLVLDYIVALLSYVRSCTDGTTLPNNSAQQARAVPKTCQVYVLVYRPMLFVLIRILWQGVSKYWQLRKSVFHFGTWTSLNVRFTTQKYTISARFTTGWFSLYFNAVFQKYFSYILVVSYPKGIYHTVVTTGKLFFVSSWKLGSWLSLYSWITVNTMLRPTKIKLQNHSLCSVVRQKYQEFKKKKKEMPTLRISRNNCRVLQ